MATTQRPGTGTEIASAERADIGAEDRSIVPERGLGGDRSNGAGAHRHTDNGGSLGHTEDELSRLRLRTQITHEGEAYCPNPNIRDLPREFETRVQVIQRYPEMRTVEKTEYVKEIVHEERTIVVPKTRVVMDEVQHVDRVPVVRQITKTRMEIFHRVVTEEREVTDMVPVIEYQDVPRIEKVPRVIVEDVEERISVPVVREVPVTRMVEVPTGNYCEAEVGEFLNPGHFNLMRRKHRKHKPKPKPKTHSGGLLHRIMGASSSSSSSSSDDEKETAVIEPRVQHHADGTTTVDHSSPSAAKRKSLLQRIIHH